MADDRDELDRAAILARRRRFVAMALTGLSGVGGCERQPSSNTLRLTVAPSCAESDESDAPPEQREPDEDGVSPDDATLALQAGEAAFAASECEEAKAYLRYYLNYADRERERKEDLDRAVDMLVELETRECVSPSESWAQPCLSIVNPRSEDEVEYELSRWEIRFLRRKQRRADRLSSQCQRPKRPR